MVVSGVLEESMTDDEEDSEGKEEDDHNETPHENSAEERDSSSGSRGGRFRRSLRRIWGKFTGNHAQRRARRSRRAVHEQGSYLGAESPRSWRPLYNPYTLPPSLSPSQPVPRIVQPDQAQMVFSPRPEVQPGTNNVVANQREGSPDGDESEPPNSQSSKFPSSSVPSKTVHYCTYPSSSLGSPIVPRTWGSSETFYSIKNPVIQSSHVATSSFQPARDIFGSPVVEYNPIPAQQAENPVSNNEKSKYRTFLSSYLFGGSQPTSSTSETPHKGPSEGMKTISGHGATSATQSEGNPSVHGSGRSTHVQGGYGYIGSQSYPTSFKSSNGRQAPTFSQHKHCKESGYWLEK
ncbi:unnamed protein product [Coregonus sp. 'balchen']|nr:unnamed protein product [Coregonus sp. 'balchen']